MGQLVQIYNNTPAKVQEVRPETKRTGKCTNPACIPDLCCSGSYLLSPEQLVVIFCPQEEPST